MSADWKEYCFGELCTITRGSSPRPIKDYISIIGIPWIKISDATSSDSRSIIHTKERIKFEGVKASVRVFPGDLILSNSATPGLPKFIEIDACIHDGWMLLRDFHNLDKNFAYWLLIKERTKLVAQGNGSVFTNLKTDILKSHRVKIPNLETQRAIASKLDLISDKIELNRQINQTLEQVAQTIFKSWFVDFEPVKAKIAAKAAGNDPERAAMSAISGKTDAELDQLTEEQCQQLAATAALFPDEMVESELGLVPVGWKRTTLTEVTKLNPESWSKKNVPDYVHYLDLANVKFGSVSGIAGYQFGDAPSRARRVLRFGDTIVGTVRPGNGSYCYVTESMDGLTGSTGFAVLRPMAEIFREFVYIASTCRENIDRLAHLADGGAYPAVRPDVIQDTGVILPQESLIAQFSSVVTSLFGISGKNEEQNVILSCVRDTLLPKLLSGDINLTLN